MAKTIDRVFALQSCLRKLVEYIRPWPDEIPVRSRNIVPTAFWRVRPCQLDEWRRQLRADGAETDAIIRPIALRTARSEMISSGDHSMTPRLRSLCSGVLLAYFDRRSSWFPQPFTSPIAYMLVTRASHHGCGIVAVRPGLTAYDGLGAARTRVEDLRSSVPFRKRIYQGACGGKTGDEIGRSA